VAGGRGISILASTKIQFCREAEMIDLKKKYWREKVTAEITVAHLQQFAKELGSTLSAAEAVAFLNERDRAQAVWMHMMQAGEEYIKSSLATRKISLYTVNRPAAQARVVHSAVRDGARQARFPV
jgi:hypothetical protein